MFVVQVSLTLFGTRNPVQYSSVAAIRLLDSFSFFALPCSSLSNCRMFQVLRARVLGHYFARSHSIHVRVSHQRDMLTSLAMRVRRATLDLSFKNLFSFQPLRIIIEDSISLKRSYDPLLFKRLTNNLTWNLLLLPESVKVIIMLPPAEKSPILVIQWSEKALKSDIIAMVKKELEKGGIILIPNPAVNTLLLSATQEDLEKQAELQSLVKERYLSPNESIMDHYKMKNRSQFLLSSSPSRDPLGLFNTNERCHLVLGILETVLITDAKLKEILNETKFKGDSSCLRYVLESHGWVETLAPLHFDENKVAIHKATFWPLWQVMPPIEAIKEYYGSEIAYYFAFLGTLAYWLGFLGILGLSCFLFRVYRQDTIDTDEYTPFYGLLCFLWAVLFHRHWERTENTLAYKFGTLTSLADDDFERDYSMDHSAGHRRPEFHGKLRTSPVTGKPELYYPSHRRKLHYLVSAIVTTIMLALAFFIMILSLNLQGYILPKDDVYHPFYYPKISSLAGKGELFDTMHSWRCFVPVIIHAVSIFTLNTLYKTIAKKLTDWENHVDQKSYENSLILKRFLFEAFDCYIALFYLAFYACDVDRLRLELIAVFNIDSFRRVLMEVMIPWLLHKLNTQVDDGHPQDLDLDAYESFDDYLEILIGVRIRLLAYFSFLIIICRLTPICFSYPIGRIRNFVRQRLSVGFSSNVWCNLD